MKVIKYIEYALLVLSLVLFIIAFSAIQTVDSPMLNVFLGWAYILVAVALIFTLGFPLVNAFKDKKSLIKLIVLVVGAVVIFGGAYLIAPGNPISVNTNVDEGTFKFADAAIYICYLFVAGAAVALIWSSRPETGIVTNTVHTTSTCGAYRQSRKTIRVQSWFVVTVSVVPARGGLQMFARCICSLAICLFYVVLKCLPLRS